MSLLLKSKEEITKSPLNTSSSKQLYSFPKAERFTKIKDVGTSSTYFYNLPEVKTSRAASIGKGFKYDFTKDSKNKNAMIYDHGSDFNLSNPHSPRYTFGVSRENIYDSTKNLNKNIPGPGQYNILKNFGTDSSKFSIRGKLDGKGNNLKNLSPGPGEYPINIQTNPEGKFPVSQFKNATQIIFGISKSTRFNYFCTNFPGPQRYNIDPLINGSGKVFISKFKSSPGKSISGKFDVKSLSKSPGPGAYNHFSEWGQYESALKIPLEK